MKKSSLLALSLVSLVSLVGCNKKSGGNKYAKETKVVSSVVSEFFGSDTVEYIDYGPEVVDLGADPSTGEEVYGPGASFSVTFWDVFEEGAEAPVLMDLASINPLICYTEDAETGEKGAPLITSLCEQNGLNFNYTAYAWDFGEEYLFDEGGETYFKYELTAKGTGEHLGYQLEGCYLKVDEEYNILMRLDVELMTVNVAAEQLSAFFGEDVAQAITATGYFQDGKINVLMASVSAFDPRKI